jgi:hypothetical protein
MHAEQMKVPWFIFVWIQDRLDLFDSACLTLLYYLKSFKTKSTLSYFCLWLKKMAFYIVLYSLAE